MATTSNAALQEVVDKIARMAFRKKKPDLRYDVNKDGRITSQDAFLVSTGRATIPTVEQNAASQITSPQAGTGSTASDPIQNLSKQLAQYINPSSSGGAWSTQSGRTSGAGFGPEGFLKKMAENFYNQTGLTDLNKLGYGKINTPENAPVFRQPIYGDYEIDYFNGLYYPIVTGYQWVTPTADLETDQNGFLVAGGYRGLSPKEIKTIKDVGNGRYTADVVVGREGYYNKDTGEPVRFDGTLGGYGEGPGWTNTRLTFEGDRPVITTTGEDTSDLGTILPIISIALLAVPGLGQAVGSALLPGGVSAATATAVGNAVINAGVQVASGVPVEKAIVNSAASLGVSQLVPNLSGNVFVDNAVKSVATAALTGGNVENALANSLIATGGNELLGNASFTGDKVVDSAIASAITSGVQAAATGGDVGASIIKGGISGASGQLAKEENVAESAKSGAGFIGEDVTNAGIETNTGLSLNSNNTGNVNLFNSDIGQLSDDETEVVTNLLQNIPVPPGTKVPTFDEILSNPKFDQQIDQWLETAKQAPELAKQAFLDPNSFWQESEMPEQDFLALANEGMTTSGFVQKLTDYINTKRQELRGNTGVVGEDVTAPTNVAGDIVKDTVTIPSSGNTVVVIEVDKNSNEALVIDEVGNTSVVSATDSATGESVNSGEVVTLTPDNSLTTGQATVAGGIADDMASGGFVDTAPVITAPVDTGVTDTGSVDTTQVATGGETSSTNNDQGITEPTNVAEPGIDPRILAQGVAGGQFGEGELLQTGSNVSSYVLPPNPQSEFGVQKNINARPDFNESSLGAKYGEISSPHYGKLISSIIINDVVDANGNPIDTPVGYYAIYDPDTNSTFYEFSLSDGTTVRSKTRPFVEQGKIFSEDKFFELKPSRQPSELNIDTGAGNGAFLGETQDLAEEPTTGITVSASKPTINQRLLDLVEQAPDQESATNATVAYYQALDNDLSDDEALNAAKTAMEAKSPPILFEDSVVEQKPTEQQVADTGLTVVGQPVNQTPVVSPTTPSVTTPITLPVVTEPVVTQPVVTEPVVTQPPVTEPIVTEPVVTEPPITQPVVTQPVVTQPVTQQPTTPDIGTTAPSTTPPGAQPVEQAPSVEPLPPPPVVEPTPPVSEVTGIVLQNNGDGTALVLTNDGNATNVPVTDSVSNEPLTPGTSVTVDQNTNTATITPPITEVSTLEPVAPVPPTVQDTGNQQVIGGGQEPTTDAGTVINTLIGLDTYTPPTPEPVVPEPPSPPPPPPEVPTTPQEPITEPLQEPVVDKTEEDLLLEQIIQELEAKPPVSEGVPIPEPEFPEPPLVLPESPTIDVGDSLTVRPRVERRATRPSVSPGSRVEESAQILPLRPGLSEGGTGGIEGTTEQEQEPVWNVRSLKLRRLLGI